MTAVRRSAPSVAAAPAVAQRRGPCLGRRAALAGLAALAAGAAAAAPARNPLVVVATTGMVGDLVRAIGGERVRLEVLMGPGVDPHLYRPTREDVARMLRADLILYNGLRLEGKMTDALLRVARAGRPVYAVAELLPDEVLIAPEGAAGERDPHVWMDPRAWAQVAELIAATLIRHDPAGEPVYRRNLDALLAALAALDAYAEQALATIPPAQRVLVTAHDAFRYFARRYAIAVEGIQGLSTESEAGVRRIRELVDLLVERRIPAVFTESSVPDRNVLALIEGAAARGHRVVLGGELFADAMGEPGTYEGTYVGMIDHNVTTIVRALGGRAPERGFAGRLRPRG